MSTPNYYFILFFLIFSNSKATAFLQSHSKKVERNIRLNQQSSTHLHVIYLKSLNTF